jgi:transcriptional regulator with XRE-family HTH domain
VEVQEKVAGYIQNSGIKQSFIVERTGLNKDIVSAILNKKRKMSADEYELFCKALNKTPNDFMDVGE